MLADALGRDLQAPVFAWDWLMAPLVGFEAVRAALDTGTRETYQDVGYALMTQLVEKQLRNGQSAILDCVARERARRRWADVAAANGASFSVVECTCGDEALHRSRTEGRARDIPGWHELDWQHVREMRTRYEPLTGAKLVVDAGQPMEENLARVQAFVLEERP
jgi:predicted kinase